MELSAVNSCSAALIITTIVGWCVHIVHRAYIVQFVCVRLIELRTHLTIRNMNGSCIKMLSIPFHISVYLLSSRDFCFFFCYSSGFACYGRYTNPIMLVSISAHS